MIEAKPKVYLFGETKLIYDGEIPAICEYLEDVGAPDFETDEENVEALLEIYGRACYRSFKPGLNKNVTRVREGNRDYLGNIINVGHGSVIEHGVVNFMFHDVSRVFTHELVRHRIGTAISQESLRYVRLDNLRFWVPPLADTIPGLKEKMLSGVEQIEKIVEDLTFFIFEGNPEIEKNFELKKKYTSLIRRLAPIGLATSIGWSANFRALRHVIEMRTSRHSEEEIRIVFSEVARICIEKWPNIFQDYDMNIVDGIPEYFTKNKKI